MSTTGHTYVEQQQAAKRERRKKVLRGIGIMLGCVLIAWLFIYFNAGKWGVPGFGFKDEYGSHCKNQMVGHVCSPTTAKEVEARAGVTLPASATVLDGTWYSAPTYELQARVLYPADTVEPAREELKQKFGDCQQGAPTPLSQIPDLKDHCIRTSDGKSTPEGQPTPNIWNVSSALQPDGQMLVHFAIRSR